MSSIEYLGFLLIFLAGTYFALRFALSTSRSVGKLDAAQRGRALHKAIAAGNHERVQLLLDGQGDLGRRDERGDVPLIVAVRNNDLEMVRLLLQKGADIFVENRGRQNAWDVAAELNAADGTVGFYAHILALLESERDVPARLLLAACRKGDLGRARNALKLGASPDTRDFLVYQRDVQKGDTALMIAAANGQLDLVRLLVEHGADINFSCGLEAGSNTALEVALARDRTEIIEYLMTGSLVRQATKPLNSIDWRIEKALAGMLGRLQVSRPVPEGMRRTAREIATTLREHHCSEVLTAPEQCDELRLTILLEAVNFEEVGGSRLRSRWLEVRRAGDTEFICSEYETVRAVKPAPPRPPPTATIAASAGTRRT